MSMQILSVVFQVRAGNAKILGRFTSRKIAINRVAIKEAYDAVRRDDSPTTWAAFTIVEDVLQVLRSGTDQLEVKELATASSHFFAYLRIEANEPGRTKFVLITWIGSQVPALFKGIVNASKNLVQSVVEVFSREIHTSDNLELQYQRLQSDLFGPGTACC